MSFEPIEDPSGEETPAPHRGCKCGQYDKSDGIFALSLLGAVLVVCVMLIVVF